MAYDKDRLRYVLILLIAATTVACGDDDPEPNPSSAGSAGRSTGGAAGSAGSQSGGSAGKGGSSSGGSSQGGSAGNGDAGADPGAGGANDAGAGGSGGDDGGAGAGGDDGEDYIVPANVVTLAGLQSPLPDVPADPTNAKADDAAAATLGQMLFFDPDFSGPLVIDSDLGTANETGKVACASCHMSATMADHRSMPPQVSIGANVHSRNAPGLVNSAYYTWSNWGGRFSAQWELPIAVVESPVIMNSTRLAVAHLIFDKYKTEYEAAFETTLEPEIGTNVTRFPATGKTTPDPADQAIIDTILVNYGKALQAYMRKLVSKNTPFDQWVAGDEQALTNQEKMGLTLFMGKARCNVCHLGPNFSDDDFHNLGVPARMVGEPPAPLSDDGRFKDVPGLLNSLFNSAGAYSDDPANGALRLAGLTLVMPESSRGAFRTPSLRGASLSAPYMHSGQIPTLEAVVEFYNSASSTPPSGTRDPLMLPLSLSLDEQRQLVAFLKTLNGDAVPSALLVDTSK